MYLCLVHNAIIPLLKAANGFARIDKRTDPIQCGFICAFKIFAQIMSVVNFSVQLSWNDSRAGTAWGESTEPIVNFRVTPVHLVADICTSLSRSLLQNAFVIVTTSTTSFCWFGQQLYFSKGGVIAGSSQRGKAGVHLQGLSVVKRQGFILKGNIVLYNIERHCLFSDDGSVKIWAYAKHWQHFSQSEPLSAWLYNFVGLT